MRKSIRKQLVLWLSLLLGSIWLISALSGYWLALKFANDAFDRELLNSADSVAARIRVKNGKLVIDLPPAAQAILRHNNIDHFYYQVLNSQGKLLSGDRGLPKPLAENLREHPIFRSSHLGNEEIRLAELRTSAEGISEEIIVQVAETMLSRRQLSHSMLGSIIFPQLLMAILGASAVWFGISLGLHPLKELQAVISRRSAGDLRAIDDSISPEETYPLVNAINNLLEILRTDALAKQRFISNASHQLRTPLAGLKTYSSLGIKTDNLEEMRVMMERIDSGLDRTSHLVSQLLALARNDSTTRNIETDEIFDLNFLVSDVVEGYATLAVRKSIDLSFQPAGKPAMIIGDRIGILQLIENLLDNAIKYTNPGGHVIAGLDATPGEVVLYFCDDGPGIAKEEREKIFERFYRIEGSPSGGTGLGLAIVKDVACNHNAKIIIESHETYNGCTFKVVFPALIPQIS